MLLGTRLESPRRMRHTLRPCSGSWEVQRRFHLQGPQKIQSSTQCATRPLGSTGPASFLPTHGYGRITRRSQWDAPLPPGINVAACHFPIRIDASPLIPPRYLTNRDGTQIDARGVAAGRADEGLRSYKLQAVCDLGPARNAGWAA